MIYLVGILSFFFFLLGFLGQTTTVIFNPFFSYVFFLLNSILNSFFFFLLGFFLICFYLHYLYKNILQTIVQAFFLCISSAFFALIGLLLVAFIHVNIYAVLLFINPNLLGITTNNKTILHNLQTATLLPKIYPFTAYSPATAVAQTSGGKNFYTSVILSSIPSFFIFPTHLSGDLVFFDNNLIITRLNPNSLQLISPLLAQLFIQKQFPTEHIKTTPQVTIFTQKQFTTFAENDAKNKLELATNDIQKMQDGVSSFSAEIQKTTNDISSQEQNKQLLIKQQDESYNSCLSAGSYVQGVFTPTHTKAFCQTILTNLDAVVAAQDNNEKALSEKLQHDQQQLKQYQYYQNFFTTQKAIIQLNSATVSDELGVFQEPYSIKVALQQNSNYPVRDFLQTLFHEYLHYTSYVPGKRFDSSFFEEGFTEFFARQVLQQTLSTTINVSYPAQVALIQTIARRIAQPDLEAFYFTKDEVGLEKALNLAYGDGFYSKNYVYFESLQYTPDPSAQTTLVNIILSHMGEQQLTEKEIFSSP